MSLRTFYRQREKGADTLISIVAGVVLWQVVERLLVRNPLILVAPTDVWGAFLGLLGQGELQRHIWTTFLEFILGYLLAVVVGLGLGVMTGVSRLARDLLNPWVTIFYNAPVITLAPLFIIALGIGIASKIAIVFIGAVFPILFNTYVGIVTVDARLVEAVRAFGGTRVQVFVKVTLPNALPLTMTGLRLGVGRALVGAIVSELFGAKAGVGHLIYVSAQEFNTAAAFVGVTLLAIGGYLTFELLKLLERKVAPWYSARV